MRQVYNSRITNWELCEVPICDECRKAEDLSEKMIEYKERQKPKKYKVINMVRCCSECDSQIKACYEFCPSCGQAIDWAESSKDLEEGERNSMSRNNPVGNIPIETPMLKRIFQSAWKTYKGMTESEVKALDKEIRSVTEINCNSNIYDIAKIFDRFLEKSLPCSYIHCSNCKIDFCPELAETRESREEALKSWEIG